MSLTTRKTALLAAILLSATTMAEDIQQVQCTDGGCGSAGRSSEGCNTKAKDTRCKKCRNHKSQSQTCNACDSGNACQTCNACDSGNSCNSAAGQCSMRDRHNAFALDWASKCGPIGRGAAKGRPLAQMLHWHATTKTSPDSGWAPPQTVPLTRTSRGYTAYNNYGMGGYPAAAPMVYQPTDTTQLGYSYANVPQWQPNPNMIPPVPIPSQFHNRFCPTNQSGGQCGGYHSGQSMYYQTMPSSCPSCNLSAVSQSVPQQQIVARPVSHTATAGIAKQAQTVGRPAALKPAVSKVRAISPPPIQMDTSSTSRTHQLNQVSQRQTVRPSNQAAQQPSGGWFGLPSLRDMKF